MKNKINNYNKFLIENNNKHLTEVTPERYVYHTSNPIFRDKIKEEGLITKGHGPTWLSDTNISGEVIFAVNSSQEKDWWDSTFDDDIYRIDTYNLKNKWFFDPNFESGIYKTDSNKQIITFDNIPKSEINLIYKGNGDSTE